MPLVYGELHKLAKRYMDQAKQRGVLQTTAVIHEAYLKLAGDSGRHWESRHHFFAVAAKAMRQVLVDYARAGHAHKRGGLACAIQLNDDLVVPAERDAALIALDDALTAFSKLYPRQGEAVELRYFGGLSVEESAKALKISPDTITRDLRFAKAWLNREVRCRRA